jgi:heme/copper-type cytochrome/quinol oxidase subunit 2
MPIVVEVLEPKDFETWLDNEKSGAVSVTAVSGE